jgi:cytochrome c oxidase subunit 4
MIAIAGAKATLVVLYFMHVRYGTRFIPVVILSGVFWLAILLVLLFADYATRGTLGIEGR